MSKQPAAEKQPSGPTVPILKGGNTVVVCPAERFIPVDFQDVYGIVKGSMGVMARQRFEEVCQLIESLYAQEFMTLRRQLKHNFLPFSVGARHQDLVTRVGKGLPPKADLDHKEVQLVADFIQLMCAARFNILSNEEWKLASATNFMFTLPVEVNWNYFDTRLLRELWQSSGELARLRTSLPDIADRCLVFHRGVGMAEQSGMFVNEKIDLVLEYAIMWPARTVFKWVRRKWRALRKKPAAAAADVQAPSGSQKVAAARDAAEAAEAAAGMHRNARVVQRLTLKGHMPNLKNVILKFPRKLRIQEPSFKEVVILYRCADRQRGKGKQTREKLSLRATGDRLRDILAKRNIHIKRFHDVPMADLECVFPDKVVFLKTLSIITMVASAVGGLVAALGALHQAGASVDWSVIWSAMSLMVARCSQVYSNMQAERSRMIQDMVNILYDKTDDAQEGVLCMLMEDMAEQQLKEAVIAYVLLLLSAMDRGPVTRDQLDSMCEDWLDTHFGLKLDFAVEDALPRLLEWELVETEEAMTARTGELTIRYKSVKIEIAHERLTQRWSVAYEALGKPAKAKVLPLSTLLRVEEKEDPLVAALRSGPARSSRPSTAGAADTTSPATATARVSLPGHSSSGATAAAAAATAATAAAATAAGAAGASPAARTSNGGGPGEVPALGQKQKHKSGLSSLFKRKSSAGGGSVGAAGPAKGGG